MTRGRLERAARCAPALYLLATLAAPLGAQDPREARVGRASNEFDAGRRLQLLAGVLDPTIGPLHGAWPVAVQLLAQTLIEEGNDSLAGVYLRWAVRLSPELRVDTVQFLPEVASAYAAAHSFVRGSRGPADSLVRTTWLWPAESSTEGPGRLQVSAPSVGPGLRAVVEGGAAPPAGSPQELAPGSYRVSATAPGHDSLAVTREVLPGVTTVLELRPTRRAVAAAEPAGPRIPAANTAVEPAPKKKFPWAIVVGGAAAAGAVVALAGGGGGGGGNGGGGNPPPPPPTTGGITLTFPNP